MLNMYLFPKKFGYKKTKQKRFLKSRKKSETLSREIFKSVTVCARNFMFSRFITKLWWHISAITCQIIMSTCRIFMLTRQLFMLTCQIIMPTCQKNITTTSS